MKSVKTATKYENRPEIKNLNQLYMRLKLWGLKNPICESCLKKCQEKKYSLVGPTLPWYIGASWHEVYPKILWYGKTLASRHNLIKKSHNQKEALDLYNWQDYKERSTFNQYIIDTVALLKTEKCFSELPNLNKIATEEICAVSNLVKCGAGRGEVDPNITERHLLNNCVNELKLVELEIEILKPDVVIFLTSSFGEETIRRFFPKADFAIKSEEIRKDYWVAKNNKRLWIAAFHPGRKSREYIRESMDLFVSSIKFFTDPKRKNISIVDYLSKKMRLQISG